MAFGFSLKGDGLRARSMRSSLLTGLGFGGSNLLRLGGNLILTRLLFPEAFGIMALIQVVMAGLNMFSDLGIHASIVQNKRGDDQKFLDTAWVMQIARGVILWLVTCAMAAPVAAFYETPILAQLLPVAGLVAIFQGFNSTKLALANRNLMLGRVTAITLSTAAVGLVVLITLAYIWGSVWALVIGSLVAPLLKTILSHIAIPGPMNRFRFERRAADSLVRFGTYIFLSTCAGFMISQADRAILGKYVSLTELALYNIAFMFASIPVLMMHQLNNTVLFPLYSRKPPKESRENYRNIAKARLVMTAAIVAMLAVLAVGGNWLVVLLYDPRYEAAGALVVLIACVSSFQIVTANYGSMMLAAGDSKKFAILQIASASLRTLILLLAIANYGIIGAIATMAISPILFYPVVVWLIRPYGGWIPSQDILFYSIACVVTTLGLWVNADAVTQALHTFGIALE